MNIKQLTLSKQKVVCILGMHRSGTSMIARVINLMGIYLGKTENIMPANKDINAEGFWEHNEIVKIHEKILKELNSSWESTKPLPEEWWKYSYIKKYKAELIEVIKMEFGNNLVWAFKDPRTCIMLPLWEEIFKELEMEPMFVIPLRNPIDIANSLSKRDGLSLKNSLRLWYYYMINILEGTESNERIFIKYDNMMEEPDLNLRKLEEFLSIDISEENKKIIKKSLNPSLRHSKTNNNELRLLGGNQVAELYNICIKFIENPHIKNDSILYSSKTYKSYSDLMEVQYADKKSEMHITSLFIDYGMGYSEETSVKQRLILNDNNEFKICFEFGESGKNIKSFRWDPLEGLFCKCNIDSILVNNNPIKISNSNAYISNKEQFDFLTIDPMCFWENNNKVVEKVVISGKIEFYEYSQIEELIYKSKINVEQITEKLYYYENENRALIDKNNDLINKNSDLKQENINLVNEKEQIVLENEDNRICREKEVKAIIDELEKKYKVLEDNKIRIEIELESVINSSSWKITKPLRWIARILK